MISYDINIYIILQYYYLHSYVCTKVHDKIWIPSFVETGLKTCNDTGGEGFGGSKKFMTLVICLSKKPMNSRLSKYYP